MYRFTPYFGDVWRGLVSPVLLYRYTDIPRRHAGLYRERLPRGHASTSLPALHVPHRNQLLRRTPMRLAIVTSHAHRLGLAPRLRPHCLGGGVRPLLRAW